MTTVQHKTINKNN